MTKQSSIINDPKYRAVLDHGFVGIVDSMGDDACIVQAARVSYGNGTKSVSEDRGLIRYLMRHHHTTPFEMAEIKFHIRAPILVIRQWHRHRTACLTSDTLINFDVPKRARIGRHGVYHLTVQEIYERFQPTFCKRADKQKNQFFKRDRVRGMLLRSFDEETGKPYHTRIVDIWQNGVKPVYKLVFNDGSILRATADHLCFTETGWLRLGDALSQGARFACFRRQEGFLSEASTFTTDELEAETWAAVSGVVGYEVSNLGRVRSFRTTRNDGSGVTGVAKIKEPTISHAGYEVVSISTNGRSRARLVHHLVLETFADGIPNGSETRHKDGNRRNNRVSNIVAGSKVENALDRMTSGCDQTLAIKFEAPVSAQPDGEEMTYDISVAGPYHNFSAGNVVVHNSINEESARYSEMTDEFYMVDAANVQPQAKDNKQGRAGVLSDQNKKGALWMMKAAFEHAYQSYKVLLGDRIGNDPFHPGLDILYDPYSDNHPLFDDEFDGIARESARAVMPVASYSEFYWKANLHNCFHFLRLRCDPHAQLEIRLFANAMVELAAPLFPAAFEAWEDYIRGALSLSRMEVLLINKLAHAPVPFVQAWVDGISANPAGLKGFAIEHGMNQREITDFANRFSLPI